MGLIKKVCNICLSPTVHKENEILYPNGKRELEEYDWYMLCKHIVRESVRDNNEMETY